MAYSREEIEALQKRLEAVETAAKELQEKDLFIAKATGMLLCGTYYEVVRLSLKGELLKSYIDHWSDREEATRKEIANSQTVEEIVDIMSRFLRELTAYLTAKKVATATEAMDIAHTFIKKYGPVALPLKAVKEGDVWLVDIDVGALAVKIAKVKVDAKTGDILSYEIPEK